MSQFDDEDPKNKALMPFSDNLPYDKNRVIQEAKFCLQVEIAARFEVGKRLLLLREHEGVATLRQILEEYFSGLKKDNAYRYMLFAKKAANLPKFQAWADGRGNFSKALALLEACEEEDLAAFEDGGDILGLKTDDIERLSVKQLQKALRCEREKREKEVAAAKRDASQEIITLKSENDSLKAAMTEPDVAAAFKIVREAEKKFMEGAALLRKITPELLDREETLRTLLFASSGMLGRLVTQMEWTAQESLNRVQAEEED